MLDIYVPNPAYSKAIAAHVAEAAERSTIAQDIIFHETLGPEQHRKKLLIDEAIDDQGFEALCLAKSACFVQYGVLDFERFFEEALEETSDLYLVFSTRFAYHMDIVSMLDRYLMDRGYSSGLIENFMSVFQELKNNALIHGNLDLDLPIKSIMNAEDMDQQEKLEKMQAVFQTLEEALADEEKGNRALVLRLVCHDDTVLLEVQDQGRGFDFEAFQRKYGDTKFTKGMDMVFLMSKDIDYNPDTKTMTVILEDPDKKPPEILEIDKEMLRIAILSNEPQAYQTLSGMLEELGIKNLQRFTARPGQGENIVEEADILLVLNDIPIPEKLEMLRELRECVDKVDLPVLCQKPEVFGPEYIAGIGPLVNDFISHDIKPFELLSRIQAHHSMHQIKRGFDHFYQHYQSELMQSQNTIESLEKIETLTLRDDKNRTRGWALINGSRLSAEAVERIESLKEQAVIPYANGFVFSQGGKDIFLYISMRHGLSSVLVISYLEGCIARLKNSAEDMTPEDIVGHLYRDIEKAAPVSFYCGIFCARWDKQAYAIDCASKGKFTLYRCDSEQAITAQDQHKTITLADTQYLIALDSCIELDALDLQEHLQNIALYHRDNSKLPYSAMLDFYSAHGIKIPYFLIAAKDQAR